MTKRPAVDGGRHLKFSTKSSNNTAQFRFLSAFKAGVSPAESCETLTESPEVDATDVKKWFKTRAALGWFCKAE